VEGRSEVGAGMNIAWVSARDYERMEGGAEQADKNMMGYCPSDLKIFTPGFDPHELLTYDKVIVSTLRGLTAQELGVLALMRPAVWVHDMEHSGHWLYNKARPFIALTPTHLEREKRVADLQQYVVNPGIFDTAGLEPGEKKADMALFAHRNIWHKGLDRAQVWAKENNKSLYVLQDVYRSEIIDAMKLSKYFVLLSHIFDPGPWSVMEAQLCGCELVIDNVGHFTEPPDELRARINNAAQVFWEDVLS
jgi:glycosyltransferase involved in cell wall biosynthesis